MMSEKYDMQVGIGMLTVASAYPPEAHKRTSAMQDSPIIKDCESSQVSEPVSTRSGRPR